MNSTFIAIVVLLRSDLGERCLVNALINISTEALRSYLDMANIFSGHSSKNKSDLVEMVASGCITKKISKLYLKDISTKELNKLLGVHKI